MANAQILKALMPVQIGGDLDGVLAAKGNALDALESAADAFLNEILPDLAYDTITDWERVFAITPASGATLAERRLALVLAMRNVGGLSRPHFIAMAALYGQTITITEYACARCGIARCGDTLYVANVQWMWTVHGLKQIASASRCGSFCCGERLSPAAPGVESIFTLLKPAHTLINFVYDGN